MATNNKFRPIHPRLRNTTSSLIWTPSLNCIPPMDKDYVASLDFFNRYLYNNSAVLRYLVPLKKKYKENPKIEARFATHKIHGGEAPPEVYLNVFTKAMREINYHTNFSVVSNDRVRRFLDLGCAPGGFSRWIIKNNPSCTGVGFTLPPELGGFKMEFDSPGQYKYFYQDITDQPQLINYLSNDDERTKSGSLFDLCIAGCIFRYPETDISSYDSRALWSPDRQFLQYSQLLVALTNLQQGGTLILVCNIRAHLYQIEIICSLSCCFEHLVPVKPKHVHAIRSSYYLVAVNYKPKETKKLNLLERLQTAMNLIKNADTNFDFNEPLILNGSHDQILTRWRLFALEHYQPMWEAQATAIEQDLSRVIDAIDNHY
jgi:SAM-dependent methyltransferase